MSWILTDDLIEKWPLCTLWNLAAPIMILDERPMIPRRLENRSRDHAQNLVKEIKCWRVISRYVNNQTGKNHLQLIKYVHSLSPSFRLNWWKSVLFKSKYFWNFFGRHAVYNWKMKGGCSTNVNDWREISKVFWLERSIVVFSTD
jgi:hypothetical protein